MVIDTSVFIEYLRAKNKHKTTLFSIPDDTTLFISSVTVYELYMGATTEEKKKDIQKLTEDLSVQPFSDEVAIQASEIYHDLRKANQLIEFRDIFIAATSIVYGFPLKTINKKDFNRIANITLA